MADESTHTGGCLCGAVRYRVHGAPRDVVACHCSQCRRTSGHHAAMTSVPEDRLELITSDGLIWYRSSSTAERGFCSRCGSNLFWRPTGEQRVAITAGSLDAPTGLELIEHIFVADKSDYYEIKDGKPQKAAW
ncbi:MAG TPA: GFA family protein [Steroidobacteraceae bacterium]|nr:GFA family protein [Steroidobacteraceae bacterium]